MSNPQTEIDSQVHDNITALLTMRRNYRQEIADLTHKYHYVVFYGCGTIFHGIVDTIWSKYIGRRVDFCCDSNPEKWGKYFCGIKCISPSELVEIKDRSTVFVTVGNFKPLMESLTVCGFSSVNLFYKYDIVSSDFLDRLGERELKSVAANLCATRQLLSDPQSIKVFDSIITRVLDSGKSPYTMAAICEPNQYFPPDIINLSDRERFVDIGAFNGDTVKEIIRRTHATFDYIFSFEVDLANFNALRENIKHIPNENKIKVFNLGIWDTECDMRHSIANLDSTVGEGEGLGHVVPLDEILKNERVTFIKMDVEGAEPNALRGARNIIKAQKPKLAICVYHHIKDLWEVPLFIKELVPEYKIYLRHHSNLEYETVCYAVV